nr:hypothetical protein [Alphaproteobacteria bacterium]
NMLAELPVKAYGQMLKDLNFLTEIKCGIDTQGDNLMLSPTTLRWVDIERTYHRNHLEGVRAMLTSSANGGTGRLDSTTEDKLQIAAAQTNTPLDEDALRKKVATLPITRVSEKRPVSLLDLGCLPLDATPRDLKCKLDQVRQHLGFVPCPT